MLITRKNCGRHFHVVTRSKQPSDRYCCLQIFVPQGSMYFPSPSSIQNFVAIVQCKLLRARRRYCTTTKWSAISWRNMKITLLCPMSFLLRIERIEGCSCQSKMPLHSWMISVSRTIQMHPERVQPSGIWGIWQVWKLILWKTCIYSDGMGFCTTWT